MKEILFDGKHYVSLDEVMEKMNYFINLAEKAIATHDEDPESCIIIAKQIRSELEKEYKNNSSKRIWDLYFDDRLFNYYRPAVHEAFVSITGRLTKKNVHSFLCDVSYYMKYYLPK